MLNKVILLLVSSMSLTIGIPLGQNSDDSILKQLNLWEMANIMMSPPNQHNMATTLKVSEDLKPIHSSHLIEASKDLATGSVLIPLETMAEAGAVGGAIPAAAAIKGSVKGSLIATPIILKAVALPGLAAGATAAAFSVPNLLVKAVHHSALNNLKTSADGSIHNLENLFIVDNLKEPVDQIEENLDLNKGVQNVGQTVNVLKNGAIGLAAKGLGAAKKGAYVAGRIILKPFAILTGVHLKMIGSGLAFGGKMIGGTGAGIAKAGTVVKYAGLGSIGLGASAIGWGLDKSTIDTHFEESHRRFKI